MSTILQTLKLLISSDSSYSFAEKALKIEAEIIKNQQKIYGEMCIAAINNKDSAQADKILFLIQKYGE